MHIEEAPGNGGLLLLGGSIPRKFGPSPEQESQNCPEIRRGQLSSVKGAAMRAPNGWASANHAENISH